MHRILLASFLVVAASACRIKGDVTYEPASSSCKPVNSACSENAGCCSYACFVGVCVANTVPNGQCRTSDDCTYTMSCVSGRCQPGAICSNVGVGCTSRNACCSGNCVGFDNFVAPPVPGTCTVNTPPTVELGGPFTVPYYATTTLVASVTDPDADTWYYAWDVVSAPAAALLGGWTSTAVSPSVFLSAKGTYVFRLRVVDGPTTQNGRASGQDTVTINAVNLPPVVFADPTHLPTTALRNTPVSLVGSVRDPNGTATPVSCEWYAKPPGQAEITTPVAAWSSCPASPTASYRTPITGPEGAWQFRLHASDGELETSDVRVVQVVNAAPVSLPCAYECQLPPAGGVPFVRAGNLGPSGQAAPAIPLYGSATDDNGDVGTAGFSWEWRLDTPAPGSALTPGTLLASGTGTAPPFAGSLEPDVVGTYVVRLHVDDGWGGSDDATVPVVVDPWLRPLHALQGGTGLPAGSVADAVYVHATTPANDRLVYAGADDASGQPRLWSLDPESAATAAWTALGATPVCLGLSPDGASALVGGDQAGSPRWLLVTLGASPSAAAPNAFGIGWTGSPSAMVDTGSGSSGRQYAVSTTGAVHELGGVAGSQAAQCDTSCATASIVVGSHAASAPDTLWLLSTAGDLRRFTVRPNGLLQNPVLGSGYGSSGDLWLSSLHSASQEIVLAGGPVLDATALGNVTSLPFPARHVDTTTVSSVLQGIAVSSAGTRVERLDAAYAAAGTLPLPRVGYLGTGYPGEAVFAFVRSDGSARYVVLRASVAGAWRWYLARY
jgi:hypothetical protein